MNSGDEDRLQQRMGLYILEKVPSEVDLRDPMDRLTVSVDLDTSCDRYLLTFVPSFGRNYDAERSKKGSEDGGSQRSEWRETTFDARNSSWASDAVTVTPPLCVESLRRS